MSDWPESHWIEQPKHELWRRRDDRAVAFYVAGLKPGWRYLIDFYGEIVVNEEMYHSAHDAMGAADTRLANLTMEKAAAQYLRGPAGGKTQ